MYFYMEAMNTLSLTLKCNTITITQKNKKYICVNLTKLVGLICWKLQNVDQRNQRTSINWKTYSVYWLEDS